MSIKVKVAWKTGTRLKSDVKATIANRFFKRIQKENDGELVIGEIVRQSRPKNAPLHNEFEWNDKIAGEKYRHQQAQYIVRHLITIPDNPDLAHRTYSSIEVEVTESETDEPKKINIYRSTEEILEDPIARQELLHAAARDANIFRKKYAVLSELSTLIKVIDNTLARLG